MMRRLVATALFVGMLGLVPAGAAAEPALSAANCTAPTITGTNGPDTLTGTAGDDVIQGFGGNDIIDGKGGDDEICGGFGSDTIAGGGGDDLINGGPGRDHLSGGFGADTIAGGRGNDTLAGNGGRDQLLGGPGDDTLDGNKGVDKLWGQKDDDRLAGGDGADRLRGGFGFDWIEGGAGNDLLVGGPQSDALFGQRDNDAHRGHGGNETIRAGLGDDFLDGGAGHELLDGGSGTNTCADEGVEIPCPTELGNAYGGHVVVADDQEPPTLNPFVPGGANFIVSIIGQSYFAGVFDIDGYSLERVPELVTELPTVANGGVTVNGDGSMTVQYTIRPEAIWSDGVPISGADFQFTLDTILDPNLPIDKTFYEDITESSWGDKTFEFTMAEPTLNQEALFDVVLPKHAVEGSNFVQDWNDAMWPSAGPFVFAEWDKGRHVRVERNDNYWKVDDSTGQHLPYLDGVTFEFIPETIQIVRAFERRQVDVIQPPPALNTIDRLVQTEIDGGVVEVIGGPVWEHIHFQFGPGRLERNPDSANHNLNYRKGVMHTIDRQLLVDEILEGHGNGVMSSHLDAYSPGLSTQAWDQYDFNPATATAYFDQAKLDLGVDSLRAVFSTTSNNDSRVQMAALLKTMFEAIGVVYENQLEDSQIFFGPTLDNGTWDLGEWAWVGSPGLAGIVESLDHWDPNGSPPDGSNYYRWGTPDSSVIDASTVRFAEIHAAANSTVDEAEIVAMLNEAESILADNAVFMPLYQRLVVLAHWGDEVANVKHNISQASHSWNIEEWHRADR